MYYNLSAKGKINMEYESKILKLFKNGYLTTKDVTDNNVPRIYLTKLIKENKIERVSCGVCIKKNILVDEFVILQSKSKYEFMLMQQHFTYTVYLIEFPLDMILQLKVVTRDHFKKKRKLIYFIQKGNCLNWVSWTINLIQEIL